MQIQVADVLTVMREQNVAVPVCGFLHKRLQPQLSKTIPQQLVRLQQQRNNQDRTVALCF